ncbi:hypothetical protein KCP77_01965 [Salmonella enterica subsp. enterica]|nr:hypothetical protein KCP77_01965 [Salmonella enterica subsp. enterica]
MGLRTRLQNDAGGNVEGWLHAGAHRYVVLGNASTATRGRMRAVVWTARKPRCGAGGYAEALTPSPTRRITRRGEGAAAPAGEPRPHGYPGVKPVCVQRL